MYKLNQFNSIVRMADGATIPVDEKNNDYQAYLAWCAEGNIPEPAFTATEIIESLKANRIAEINAACAAAIVGGFGSSALGTPHTYDSALEDQLNLIGAVGLGVNLPYRCIDSEGIKEFRLHTAAQLKQVAADGAAIKLAALGKAATLKTQVQAAADAATVEAVIW